VFKSQSSPPPQTYYLLGHDPRAEIEDPDDRPYIWDLEE
jgi:hypothetical protein